MDVLVKTHQRGQLARSLPEFPSLHLESREVWLQVCCLRKCQTMGKSLAMLSQTHVRIVQSSYVMVKSYGLNLASLISTNLAIVGDHVFGSIDVQQGSGKGIGIVTHRGH